jgi:hypothetical protein
MKETDMRSSVLVKSGEISEQNPKKRHEAGGQRLAATGIAAAFVTSLGIFVCPVGGARAAAPTVQIEVGNRATNPVLTSSVDDPTRTAYESNVNCSLLSQGIACQANFAAVPQGQRLVIQHISAALLFTSDPQLVQVSIKGSPNQGISAFFVPSPISTTNSFFDQAILQFFDGGSTPVVEINALASNFSADARVTQPVTLTGYLLTCNAATPCAPIAP